MSDNGKLNKNLSLKSQKSNHHPQPQLSSNLPNSKF